MKKLIIISLFIILGCGKGDYTNHSDGLTIYKKCVKGKSMLLYVGTYKGSLIYELDNDGKPIKCDKE